MILNVKKSNFMIYLFCLLIGIILIVSGIIAYHKNSELIVDELLLSIGCSTIPTIITAYLIDQASEKRSASKTKELRNHFLWGMPHGLLCIMKTVIEHYPVDSSDKTFLECFNSSVQIMKNKQFDDSHFLEQGDEVKRLQNKLDYGLSLCLRDCKTIIDHDYELEINSVFSKDELITITYLYEECDNLKKVCRLCEMAEYIRLFVNTVVESIPEISEKVFKNAIVKNGRIENWIKIIR